MKNPIPKIKTRTTFNYDPAAWSDATGLACNDPSRTVQSQEAEANINNIVRDFGLTGTMPQGVVMPSYGDFEGVSDYREAIELVRAADAAFAALPSAVRNRMENNPQNLLEFVADPRNQEEIRALGLALPRETPPPPKTPETPPATA